MSAIRKLQRLIHRAALIAACAVLLLPSCTSREMHPAADGETYPPGRWRLLSVEERGAVVLWLSHVLVMHRESRPDLMPYFRLPEWPPDTLPSRSPEAALRIAATISAEAQRARGSFPRLVTRHSDDVVPSRQTAAR